MRILLFGCNGQVGWELCRSLAPLGELLSLSRDGGRQPGCDLRDGTHLAEVVRQFGPDVIVNAAAYTDVERAESEPEIAHVVNARAVGVLAEEAAARGALLVHYSTDYVFDGSGTAAWLEQDRAGPLNVYGTTKKEGEDLVVRHCPFHLILRTSWIYGVRGKSFPKAILHLASQRERLAVVDDQVGAPTGADLLADLTAHMVRATIAAPALAGMYHATASGETTWCEYARHVLRHASNLGMLLRAGPEQVDPVPSSSQKTAARRPLNSRLDTGKLRSTFGFTLPEWQSGVARLLDQVLLASDEWRTATTSMDRP